MIRAAIVGIGWWGRMLVNAVQGKSAAIRFTAGYTRTRATAEGFCAEHSIALANDLDALLADPAVDAIVFATPHSQHGPQVERAAASGKPVFMEKPFTLDVASAERALDAAGRAGIVLAVAYPRRFHPSVAELKGRIADGRLGVLSHCQSEQTAPAGLSMRADYWRSDPVEAPAGAMTATGVHSIDLLIHLFGRIDEVYCLSHRRVMARLEDTNAVLFGLANGMSASTARSSPPSAPVSPCSAPRAARNSGLRSSSSASLQRPRDRALDATPRPPPRSSSTKASIRCWPNLKPSLRRSAASRPIRSRPRTSCTALRCLRRLCVRPNATSRPRLRGHRRPWCRVGAVSIGPTWAP